MRTDDGTNPMPSSALSIVQQWHTALNAGQLEQLMTLVHPHVEIGGPRGIAIGAEVIRQWFGRANLRLLPERWFAHGNQVVVEELATWLSAETGEVAGSQLVASVFKVDDGLITRIVRHDALAEALDDAALTAADEVKLA